MNKSAFDVQHPFFLPLWRRIVTVALCLGWALVEISGGNTFWAVLFGGVGVYCAHQFFIAFDEDAIRAKLEDKDKSE